MSPIYKHIYCNEDFTRLCEKANWSDIEVFINKNRGRIHIDYMCIHRLMMNACCKERLGEPNRTLCRNILTALDAFTPEHMKNLLLDTYHYEYLGCILDLIDEKKITIRLTKAEHETFLAYICSWGCEVEVVKRVYVLRDDRDPVIGEGVPPSPIIDLNDEVTTSSFKPVHGLLASFCGTECVIDYFIAEYLCSTVQTDLSTKAQIVIKAADSECPYAFSAVLKHVGLDCLSLIASAVEIEEEAKNTYILLLQVCANSKEEEMIELLVEHMKGLGPQTMDKISLFLSNKCSGIDCEDYIKALLTMHHNNRIEAFQFFVKGLRYSADSIRNLITLVEIDAIADGLSGTLSENTLAYLAQIEGWSFRAFLNRYTSNLTRASASK